MVAGIWVKIIGSVATIVVGGGIAAVTLFGLVHNQVNSASNDPGNSSSPTIDYGSNG